MDTGPLQSLSEAGGGVPGGVVPWGDGTQRALTPVEGGGALGRSVAGGQEAGGGREKQV